MKFYLFHLFRARDPAWKPGSIPNTGDKTRPLLPQLWGRTTSPLWAMLREDPYSTQTLSSERRAKQSSA